MTENSDDDFFAFNKCLRVSYFSFALVTIAHKNEKIVEGQFQK
jgi:hypothetical protein